MQIENIIKSADYIEFVNKIDDLVNELIYSKNSGYINLLSKDALKNANSIVEKFNYEADKIAREYQIPEIENLIADKKSELLRLVDNHYQKQVYAWINEIFNHTVENCLLKVSICKDGNIKDKVYSRMFSAFCWITKILNIPKNIQSKMLEEINTKFNNALKSDDYQYIKADNPIKSDAGIYLDLRVMIKTDCNSFLNVDLNNYRTKLSAKDLNYFNKIKNKLQVNKTDVIDEINLIDSAVERLDIKKEDIIYEFINSILDDFQANGKLDENQKVDIIKRRMKIFKNKDEYFMKLFSF